MKWKSAAFLLAASLPLSCLSQDAEMRIPSDGTWEHPFDTFFGLTPYSPTFGLVLLPFGADPKLLYEESYPGLLQPEKNPAPGIASENYSEHVEDFLSRKIREGFTGTQNDLRERLAAENLLWVDNYEKLGFNKQLRFRDDKGSAVLLRIREKFQILNEESGAASWTYVDDRVADKDGSSVKAAAMLDFYLDPLYNGTWKNNTWWIRNPYRFWFRIGAEIDRNTIDQNNPTDTVREYLLLNFQANPDQSARLFGIGGLEVTSPQIFQLGVVHEDNRIADEESWRWILGWEPRLVLNEGWFASTVGRGFALNNRMYYKKGSFGVLATEKGEQEAVDPAAETARIEDQRSRIFSFINPVVSIEGASDARVSFPSLAGVKTLQDLRDLQDEVITYKISTGLGFDLATPRPADQKAFAKFSYTLHGIQPLDFSGGHVWHELRADLNLTQSYAALNGEEASSNNWAGWNAYISWTKGDAPPTYQKTDLLMAGMSLRF